MNNHIDQLIKHFNAMPGSDACLIVADQLEELGDPNSEIIRESLLLDTGDGFGSGSGYGYGGGFGSGGGSGYGGGFGYGGGSGGGSGGGYGGE